MTDRKPCPHYDHHKELAAAHEARAEQLAHELSLANLALHLVSLPSPEPAPKPAARKPWRADHRKYA